MPNIITVGMLKKWISESGLSDEARITIGLQSDEGDGDFINVKDENGSGCSIFVGNYE